MTASVFNLASSVPSGWTGALTATTLSVSPAAVLDIEELREMLEELEQGRGPKALEASLSETAQIAKARRVSRE